MITIPYSLEKPDANFITVPCMQRFAKSHDLNTNLESREELLSQIKNFSKTNDANLQIVDDWLDQVFREGIRDLYITEFEVSQNTKALITSKDFIEQILFQNLVGKSNNHFVPLNTKQHFSY
jgi:hypothetical protein